MDMKITSTCPNCNKDVVITGVKLVFDKPAEEPKVETPKPISQQVFREGQKEYVGWTSDSPTQTITIDNSTPGPDSSKLVKEVVKEEPKRIVTQEDIRPQVYTPTKQEQEIIDSAKVAKPVTIDPEHNEDVIRKELIPELRTLTQALRDQAKAQEVCILCDKKVENGGTVCDQCLRDQIDVKTKQGEHNEEKQTRRVTVW